MLKLAQQIPGGGWIDRKTEFSELFGHYRLYLSYLLMLSVAAIAVIYLWRFGLRHALRCMVPTLLSLGGGIAALALSGHTLNLFSLLALVLVLGIGINYTLFFTNPRGTPTTSMFAIFMAVFTTQLTFGMAGDFNAWSRRRINALYQFAGDMALREVNFTDDHRRKAFGRPLDFVFYRDLGVAEASVLVTRASDHNPLLVEFQPAR